MVKYVLYNGLEESKLKYKEIVNKINKDKLNYGVITMNSLLSDFVKLGRKHINAIIVTDTERMGDVLKNAIAPLISNLAEEKDVYILAPEDEYNAANKNKLMQL